MNKEEVCEALGISRRTLQRRMSKGEIGYTLKGLPGSEEAVFDAKEVERVRQADQEGAQGGTIAPALSPVPRALQRPEPLAEALIQMAEAVRHSPPTVLLGDKLALTLAEAAQLVSLSKDYLRSAIKAGKLKAARRGRGWHIKRADLEAWVKKL